MNISNRNSLALFTTLFCVVSAGHQTNSAHPLITEKSNNVIEKSDNNIGAYLELYKFSKLKRYENKPTVERPEGPVFSGKAAIFNADEAVRDAAHEAYPTFQGLSRDMIDGVVAEDMAPPSFQDLTQRVYSHFYHAYSGEGLWTNYDATPSRLRGEKYFAESASLMGYLDELEFDTDTTYWRNGKPSRQSVERMYDKHLAYFIFGFSLHHVEDMSSIAHVHNDAHLDTKDEARDDYEAVFIPYFIWRTPEKGDWFLNGNSSSVEVNKFDDIWPDSTSVANGPDWNTNSLARRVYNASIFQANIPSPKSNFGILYWDKDTQPTGELIDMFGLSGGPTTTGSFWHRRYEIAGFSAEYKLIYDTAFINEWQLATPIGELEISADSLKTDPINGGGDIWPVGELGGPQGYYYIEEHIKPSDSNTATENKFQNCKALVSPKGVRSNLFAAYDKEKNKLAPTTEKGCGSILGKFAETLVPMGIQYSAAYTKWWFDVANTPPYLRRLKVEQEVSLANANGSPEPEKRKTTVYDARWRSTLDQGVYDETQWKNTGCDGWYCGDLRYRFPFYYVSKRTLKQKEKLDRGMLTSAFPIELTLEFNEPIKILNSAGNFDTNSGFHLGFEPVSKTDGSGTDIWLTNFMMELKYEEAEINTDDDYKPPKESDDKGRIWKVTIPTSVLEKFEVLKRGGPMRLIVRANDKNKHTGDPQIDRGNNVGSLDVHPETPARRNIVRDNRIGDPNTTFLWHKNKSKPDTKLFPNAKEGDFDYDVHDRDDVNKLGDRNHVLLFSRSADKALFENLKDQIPHDTVSTTLEPKKQEKK